MTSVLRKSSKKLRPKQQLVGEVVAVQSKSQWLWIGIVESFEGGWLILKGEVCRWMPNGSLSSPVSEGRFMIDRSDVSYICDASID